MVFIIIGLPKMSTFKTIQTTFIFYPMGIFILMGHVSIIHVAGFDSFKINMLNDFIILINIMTT